MKHPNFYYISAPSGTIYHICVRTIVELLLQCLSRGNCRSDELPIPDAFVGR